MSITAADTSQATRVEQARAVAEVAAAAELAMRNPRDEERALTRFLSACSRMRFAERAFFRYSRGGKSINGPSIDFALEALRCWGNTISGSSELVRRDRESEMIAYAWDLETNSQRRTTFVNPHVGYADTPTIESDGSVKVRRLIASRDIREGNQSVGSRVEREQILAVLPEWYVEEGVAACYATVEGQSSKPIEDQRREMVRAFEELGVRREQLERHVGVSMSEWIPPDLASLRVIGAEIKRGERTIDEAFPAPKGSRPAGPTSVDTGDLAAGQASPEPPAQDDAVDTPAERASQRVLSAIMARLTELGYEGRVGEQRARRIRLLALISGEQITSAAELSPAGAEHIRAYLAKHTADDLAGLLDEDAGDDEDRAAREDT